MKYYVHMCEYDGQNESGISLNVHVHDLWLQARMLCVSVPCTITDWTSRDATLIFIGVCWLNRLQNAVD